MSFSLHKNKVLLQSFITLNSYRQEQNLVEEKYSSILRDDNEKRCVKAKVIKMFKQRRYKWGVIKK